MTITQAEYDRVAAHFTAPGLRAVAPSTAADKAFARWVGTQPRPPRCRLRAVTLSLKHGTASPGRHHRRADGVADLADQYSFGELRISHEQNVIPPTSKAVDLQSVAKAVAGAWRRRTSAC